MSDTAIRVEGLSKRYRIGKGERYGYKALRDTLTDALYAPWRAARAVVRGSETSPSDAESTIWALKDVSFEVKHGEVVGLIGRNGAGKSTLLKILSRITEPTEGQARIRGRVGSLLEVGTGFHPELTGRENIYLNGAILGMRKDEIERKFDEIVAFAEVEKFMDTPVKRYSSGMFVRLAFAVAAHLEPEVLLVDEVLAVGDAAFQKKCLGKMGDVASEGRTVIFVSHNMAAIQALCGRALLLDGGKLTQQGAADQVVQHYLQSTMPSEIVPLAQRRDRQGDGSVRITALRVENAQPDGVIRTGDRLRLTIEYAAEASLKSPVFSIGLYDFRGLCVCNFNSENAGWGPDELPRSGHVVCVTDPINFVSGLYWANVLVKKGGIMADYIPQACSITVEPADFYGTGRLPDRSYCLYLLKNQWTLESANR